jgi:hypothetical protein
MTQTLFKEPEMSTGTELATREVSPMALLQDAVKGGMSPDQLAVLVGLQRDMADDAAKRAYAESMTACQADMPTVVADATNPDTGKKFPRFESIQQIAKPIYSKYGFALTFSDAACSRPEWKRTACDCRHKAGHLTHHYIELPVDGISAKGNPMGKMNPVQGCVSTNSYAQRVLTCNIFNITIAGKDGDGRPLSKPITQEQIDTLQQWMQTIGAEEHRVLKWRKVESWAEMNDHDFNEVLSSFKQTAKSIGKAQ